MFINGKLLLATSCGHCLVSVLNVLSFWYLRCLIVVVDWPAVESLEYSTGVQRVQASKEQPRALLVGILAELRQLVAGRLQETS